VKKENKVLHGDCDSVPDYTYVIVPLEAVPSATTTVVDRPVYDGGSGCCIDSEGCSGLCEIQETFQVVTSLGDVPAGSFHYQVIFDGCAKCASASAASRNACPARLR